jgi:hypothetical protein
VQTRAIRRRCDLLLPVYVRLCDGHPKKALVFMTPHIGESGTTTYVRP